MNGFANTSRLRHRLLGESTVADERAAGMPTKPGLGLAFVARCTAAVVLRVPSSLAWLWGWERGRVGRHVPATARPDHPVCRRPTLQGAGQGQGVKAGAPYRKNDLEPLALVCSACTGSMADGMIRTNISHPYCAWGARARGHPGVGAPPPEACTYVGVPPPGMVLVAFATWLC
jgi:hypothetical protein